MTVQKQYDLMAAINFMNICCKNDFVFKFMTTELFIIKDASKTDETLHDECSFKCRKYNSRCIALHLVLMA